MTKPFSYIFISFLLISIACHKETDLNKSIFMDDKENPGLPEYSEWGYNTFGVYFDRAPFVSKRFSVPAKINVTNGETTFLLEGELYTNNYAAKGVRLEFVLPEFLPSTYPDLMSLHDTSLDLTQTKVFVTMDETRYPAEVLEGTLQFTRAQNLLVDKKQFEVILSGRFDLKAVLNTEAVTFSNGRFDIGFSEDNFFKF
jgi:hypothetical protein